MKLCSICDRKIEGTWCKTCKRFVKTYDISDDIHLNQSHDPKNDTGCTYHTTTAGNTYRTTSNTGTAANRTGTTTYRTQTSNTANRTTSTTSTQATKSKAGKIVAIVVVVYVLMGMIMPLLANGVIKGIISDIFESEDEAYEFETDTPELDVSAAQFFLQNVKPVDTEVREEESTTFTYSYYNPETIAISDISCDAFHFDFEIDDLDKFMEEYFGDRERWYTEEETLPETNYLMEYNDEAFAYFETDRYYEFEESLMLSVDYDTASEKMHGLLFAADAFETESEDYYAIYHALVKKLDREYDDSKLSLARKIDRAIQDAEGGYGEVDVSDKVNLMVSKDQYGRIIIAFYPY